MNMSVLTYGQESEYTLEYEDEGNPLPRDINIQSRSSLHSLL